jgi:hypothetical protein
MAKDQKTQLLEEVRSIEGLEERPSPVSGGSALFYHGREFAHFHNANELDLRLTKTVIHSLGLIHPPNSVQHPGRSPNSPWIELRFNSEEEVKKVAALISVAVTKL